MNKEFVKKMIKAEMLRYEAIKEILPESMKNRIQGFEKDAGNLLKDIVLEIVSENWVKTDTTTPDESKKSVKRVDVDFN